MRLPGGFALNLMRGPGLISGYDMMVMVVGGGGPLERAGDGRSQIRDKGGHDCYERLVPIGRAGLRTTTGSRHALGSKSERMG